MPFSYFHNEFSKVSLYIPWAFNVGKLSTVGGGNPPPIPSLARSLRRLALVPPPVEKSWLRQWPVLSSPEYFKVKLKCHSMCRDIDKLYNII